jgi:hypothetical protein
MLFKLFVVASQMPTIQSQNLAAKAYFNSVMSLRGGATRLCRVEIMLDTPAILAAMAAYTVGVGLCK